MFLNLHIEMVGRAERHRINVSRFRDQHLQHAARDSDEALRPAGQPTCDSERGLTSRGCSFKLRARANKLQVEGADSRPRRARPSCARHGVAPTCRLHRPGRSRTWQPPASQRHTRPLWARLAGRPARGGPPPAAAGSHPAWRRRRSFRCRRHSLRCRNPGRRGAARLRGACAASDIEGQGPGAGGRAGGQASGSGPNRGSASAPGAQAGGGGRRAQSESTAAGPGQRQEGPVGGGRARSAAAGPARVAWSRVRQTAQGRVGRRRGRTARLWARFLARSRMIRVGALRNAHPGPAASRASLAGAPLPRAGSGPIPAPSPGPSASKAHVPTSRPHPRPRPAPEPHRPAPPAPAGARAMRNRAARRPSAAARKARPLPHSRFGAAGGAVPPSLVSLHGLR
jgi:hypothetical protein